MLSSEDSVSKVTDGLPERENWKGEEMVVVMVAVAKAVVKEGEHKRHERYMHAMSLLAERLTRRADE